MAVKQNAEGAKATPTSSLLKDDIISQIRQIEELRRETQSVQGGGSRAAESRPAVASAAAGLSGVVTSRGQSRAAATPMAGTGAKSSAPGRFFSPSIHVMATFCRQMATLIDSGIPLLRTLQILSERTSNPRMKSVVADLALRVEQGQPLSVAMMAHPNTFTGMFTGVVRAGEAAGILEDSLRRLADMLERRAQVFSRIRAALVMPVLALLVEIVVIGLIVFVAMPKMLAAYPDPEKFPETTKFLLGVVHWTSNNWILLTLMIGALISAIVVTLRLPAGKAAFQSALLRLPIIGNIIRRINVARFSRTLGSLTAAGIPLIDAIGIAAETSDNLIVERVLLRTRDAVETGGKMDEPLRSEPVFDEIVVDMVAIGDEAGALDTVMLKVADTYDAEVDSTLRGLSSLLEPILIIFLGVGVAFVAVAAFEPYLKLVTSPTMMQQ